MLAFSVLLVSLVVGVIYFVPTSQFKSALEEFVRVSTGYELIIAGDLDINFFPSIGLTLNDVRLRNPGIPQELASTSAISLRLDAALLLQGQLLIQEFRADDFHINWYTDAQGQNIWDIDPKPADDVARVTDTIVNSTANSNAAAPGIVPTDDAVIVSFERISIANASIDIQDVAKAVRYGISNLNLESSNANSEGRPFALDLNFDFNNNGMSKPMSMGLRSNITVNLNQGNINLSDLYFNLTPMLLQGQVAITNLNDELNFNGRFQSNNFDVMGLLQTLGLVETDDEFTAASAGVEPPQLAIEFNFSGDENGLSVPNFSATLGTMELEADGNIRYATEFIPTNISYDIIGNDWDITPFMSASTEEIAEHEEAVTEDQAPATADTTPPTPPEDTELPIELLNSFNILGSISIESLTVDDLLFRDINIFTNIEDGVLDIELQPVTAFAGTIQGNIRLDARSDQALLTTQLKLNQLNIVELLPLISRLNSVTGKLDMEVDYHASGATVNALTDSISGSTTFAITENSVDIGVIKQVFTAIAALSPTGGAIQQWPDVIQFSEVAGYILLEDGITDNQQVKLRMDNFDISGTGGIDLGAESFNYELWFTVLGEPFAQTIQINQLYHDVSWPVQCSAAFDDAVTQYCRPDFTQVRQIFTQIGSNAIKDRLNDAIINKVPQELQDTARDLLRNIFN